ncbi:hypothetical protein AB0K71_31070 [Streptomyces syringium]|uniref:hypothetical protein n=1 Tax=Streptomyces syringium TaxID=76729 RepID=UPI0033F0E11D
MIEPRRTKELPASLLTDPEMIDACRRRDFTRVFRLVKTRAGIYPSMIARQCYLTPSRVGEVIAAKRQLLNMDVIERIADGLRIPGHMVGLARRPWETPAAPAEAERGTRDSVTRPVEFKAFTGLPGVEVDSVLALAAGGDPSPSTLQSLRTSIEDYWRRDDEHGGETLRPAVIGQLRYVEGLLKDRRPTPIQHGLYGIAAELARLTGWTYFDARQFHQARAYFSEALQLAREIDDHLFMANVLACMSLQATYQDKPGDALALVSAAQDSACAARDTTSRVRAMLAMREAFAHATLGDRRGTHTAIFEAHNQFGNVRPDDPDPAWVTYFDEPKLIVDTGIAHGRLGEAAIAEPLIAEALERENPSNQRGRAFHAFWLARTQLQRGEIDQACQTATEALAWASAVTSERVARHLRELYEQLAPHREASAAVAFEARLREALPVSGQRTPSSIRT